MIFKASDSIFSVAIGIIGFHINYQDLFTKINNLF